MTSEIAHRFGHRCDILARVTRAVAVEVAVSRFVLVVSIHLDHGKIPRRLQRPTSTQPPTAPHDTLLIHRLEDDEEDAVPSLLSHASPPPPLARQRPGLSWW